MQYFDVLVVHFETNTMDSDNEYYYSEFIDLSSSDDDKDEDEIAMMTSILEKTIASMFFTSRVQQRDIEH